MFTKTFLFNTVAVLILCTISNARRSDFSIQDNNDELIMMKIQEKRARKRMLLHKLIKSNLEIVEGHENGNEVMEDKEYKRTLKHLNLYKSMLDDVEKPSDMSWDDQVEQEMMKMKSHKEKLRRQTQTRKLFQELSKPLH
mmetsp:Transcript_20290/g.25083  ORF Transcript_20290/g.25083 Transcript_20290/m.25083 type:complete len:140 (-) Transcript_20290:158-577(-)|eukprot:CAMPEP_0172498282 /NCGR_PEP_ID=MMETSP1066-20121228/111742_1 /TAXON_ID=671091 /ORGANISM="Coscinodiscus wailesii, Strain CCMP2513" /LENGTH=139 /DNA_ID=CAMNT_0013271505 /DNA_START=111 /DNA_END=530 /DNA_ORIENTATION=-